MSEVVLTQRYKIGKIVSHVDQVLAVFQRDVQPGAMTVSNDASANGKIVHQPEAKRTVTGQIDHYLGPGDFLQGAHIRDRAVAALVAELPLCGQYVNSAPAHVVHLQTKPAVDIVVFSGFVSHGPHIRQVVVDIAVPIDVAARNNSDTIAAVILVAGTGVLHFEIEVNPALHFAKDPLRFIGIVNGDGVASTADIEFEDNGPWMLGNGSGLEPDPLSQRITKMVDIVGGCRPFVLNGPAESRGCKAVEIEGE